MSKTMRLYKGTQNLCKTGTPTNIGHSEANLPPFGQKRNGQVIGDWRMQIQLYGGNDCPLPDIYVWEDD